MTTRGSGRRGGASTGRRLRYRPSPDSHDISFSLNPAADMVDTQLSAEVLAYTAELDRARFGCSV
jgi:hypothetical protein